MIGLEFNDNGLQLNLNEAQKVTPIQIQKWLTRVMAQLHRALNQNMAGGLIGRRTGNLMRSLLERIEVIDEKNFIGEVWPDPAKAPYGTIQEEGGTIVPKKARALAIPLPAMLTGNGVARGSAAQVRDNPHAFGFSGTFIPKGKHVVMGKLEGSKEVIPLFALKESVTIPGRHYMAITLQQNWTWIADELQKLTGEMVNVVFKESAA